MDKMVQDVQQWLNDTWPEKFKYDETGAESGSFPVKPDGMTGNTTVKALVMALQLRLGLTADGAWGSMTTNACPVINSSTTNSIIVRIVQGGFICKGYNPGGFDGAFGPRLQGCINVFKEDLGRPEDSQLKPLELKSLLTTDPTLKVSAGTYEIRAVQQFLNREYGYLFEEKLGYLPTGGIFERKTAKALIYAFQKKINTDADGSIGNKTYLAMPNISVGASDSDLVKILQCALTCNGYTIPIDGNYTDTVKNAVINFQSFVRLDLDPEVTLGSVNRRTWSALLQSKGDPLRTANACDCATVLDKEKATLLAQNGYTIVGRYLTGTVIADNVRVSKAMTHDEIRAITNAGLRIFPIYQDGGARADYFKYDQGFSDATKAVGAAVALNIPYGEIIYFAVDYDFNEAQCKEKIIPHFEGIAKYMNETIFNYKVGIYGSRNICSTICEKGLACSSFVADMSTEYSGNQGFTMPENWAFDQFHEYRFMGQNISFSLDKDMASGRYTGFNLNSKCGQDYYYDCTLHNMRLKSDGNYVCFLCNYSVPSPSLQDEDILSTNDYLKVVALEYAYAIMLAQVDEYGIFFHDWWDKIYEIRTKSEYTGQYSYCDKEKKCLYIPPEIDPTGVSQPMSKMQEPALITTQNINKYNDVISEITDFAIDTIFGLVFSPTLAESILLAISDFQQDGNYLSSFNSVLQALVSKTEAAGFGYILQALELGATINELENAKEISIGDTVVEIDYYQNSTAGKILYVIFDSELKLKNCYFKDL